MPNRAKFTTNARARFLDDLRRTANVTKAAAAANISRRCAYDHRESDKEFAALWDDAVDEAVDALESEARRRAIDGWLEPVFWQGAECGAVRKYSDRMLEIMLRAHRPKFRASSVELSGPGGGEIKAAIRVEFVKPADDDS